MTVLFNPGLVGSIDYMLLVGGSWHRRPSLWTIGEKVIEIWVLWHTLENSGFCDIHWRILGCVTYIGENWVAWHTDRHPEKMCLFSVPLSWNTMTILNWKPLSVLDRHISSPLSLYINHRVLETVFSSCLCRKQVTRGHKIVADGWAGASNPRTFHPYTHAHFPLFDIIILVRRTDRRTDKASYRVACPDLKKDL